jgi:hypothetical protein
MTFKVSNEVFPNLSVSKVNTLFENENVLSNISPYLLTKSESIIAMLTFISILYLLIMYSGQW